MPRSLVAGGSTSASQTYIPDLPRHETVNHALTSNAQTSIQALSKSRQFQLLDEHHKAALELLTDCTVDVTDLMYERNNQRRKDQKRKNKAVKAKRSKTATPRGRSKTAVNSEDEEHEANTGSENNGDEMDVETDEDDGKKEIEFSTRVDQLTGSAELHVRKIIDGMQRRRDDEEILKDLVRIAGDQRAEVDAGLLGTQTVASQRLTQRLSRGDIDDSQFSRMSSVTAPGETQSHDTQFQFLQPSREFVQKTQEAKDTYSLLSMSRKYAHHNDYIYFRRQVWEAAHGDEEVPMPSRSTWFPGDTGRGASPAPGMTTVASLEDDDDDVQTISVKISTKCPLSLTEMQNPVSSRRCPHVFEKMAVEQFIRMFRSTQSQNRSRGAAPIGNPACPVTGCNEHIGLTDLYVDPAVQRKIKRIQDLRKRQNESADDDRTIDIESDLGRRTKSRTVEGFEEVEDDFDDDI